MKAVEASSFKPQAGHGADGQTLAAAPAAPAAYVAAFATAAPVAAPAVVLEGEVEAGASVRQRVRWLACQIGIYLAVSSTLAATMGDVNQVTRTPRVSLVVLC